MSTGNMEFSYGPSPWYSYDFTIPSLRANEQSSGRLRPQAPGPLSSSLPQASPDLFDDLHSFAGSTPNSGFSHGAYMHQPTPNFIAAQQAHALQEQLAIYQARLAETQLELSKTITKCDTIKASFTELISVLRLPDRTNPLNFSLTNDLLTGHDKVRPSQDSHPKICFWSRVDYDKYIENAESGTGTRGKAPWLELEDGKSVMVEQLKSICKALRAAWAELVVQKLAPPTWSRICATGKKLVFDIMVKQFPLFLFDHCGWKLKLLCITDYPSWRKNNLGNNGKLEGPTRQALKISESKHDGPRAKGNSKRRLSDDSESLDRQDHLKKPKFDSAPSPLLRIEPKVDPGAISPTLLSTNMPLHPDQNSGPGTSTDKCVPSPIDDSLALENTLIMPTYPRDASTPPFGVYLLQPTPQGPSLPRSPLRQTVYTSETKTLPTPRTPRTSRDIQHANKENTIILQDPLADIFGPNGIAKTIPAPALSPIKQTNKDGPSISNTKSVVKTEGKKKMRPGATKNAQNLCAWRWLKQVNDMSGTTEEFCVYWAALATAQQDEYKADAERLQSAGTWTKGSDCAVCDGALY
ncbi:uncharacterized protein EDB91DRAFT_1089239 [Suillus paluster]|uniref:uncharacterized protein n=1 Tax=Suillus paluster TaxID=48578 RepID=UPI001B85F85D|nr:uncharacterized protein EDB91DRAFT_1089239 [Suillus paluster]KAG1719623.1 hypothetical protein EDB91DRAFT_1089239 [Suillus paluster]